VSCNPDIHHRRSLRLRDYDYRGAGAYFVTLCSFQRECLFGQVEDGEMVVNEAGRMVRDLWEVLPERFQTVQTEDHVVMPNHFHGIIMILDGKGDLLNAPKPGVVVRRGEPCVRPGFRKADDMGKGNQRQKGDHEDRPYGTEDNSLGRVVLAFKSLTTHAYIRGVNFQEWPPFPGRLWQRNYYDRVIRTEKELANIRQYIADNPAKWEMDENNPVNAVKIP
jgi:REP element-mobilizing transposase RayT